VAGSVTPDLNIANVWRIDGAIGDLVVANATNVRDCQYLRLEIVSAAATGVDFGVDYLVNGAVIADTTHDGDELVIYEGWYNADTEKWSMVKLSSLAA
jgi:hypothetical protein